MNKSRKRRRLGGGGVESAPLGASNQSDRNHGESGKNEGGGEVHGGRELEAPPDFAIPIPLVGDRSAESTANDSNIINNRSVLGNSMPNIPMPPSTSPAPSPSPSRPLQVLVDGGATANDGEGDTPSPMSMKKKRGNLANLGRSPLSQSPSRPFFSRHTQRSPSTPAGRNLMSPSPHASNASLSLEPVPILHRLQSEHACLRQLHTKVSEQIRQLQMEEIVLKNQIEALDETDEEDNEVRVGGDDGDDKRNSDDRFPDGIGFDDVFLHHSSDLPGVDTGAHDTIAMAPNNDPQHDHNPFHSSGTLASPTLSPALTPVSMGARDGSAQGLDNNSSNQPIPPLSLDEAP